jgi:SAM-dependent methyltransferase
MKKKYSKSSTFYLPTKSDFFSANADLLNKALKQNKFYSTQPKRDLCKLCGANIQASVDFVSHGVGYVFCDDCNHLNGIYEDTKTFVENLYMSDAGVEYASNYIDEHFEKRVEDIYLPKVDFLVNTLPPKVNNILDVGCGSGYFVYAALIRNLKAVGLDVSKTMVEFGNSQIERLIKTSPLLSEEEDGFFEAIKKTDADVISAIGVIEHLREPQRFFDAFKQSKATYLYYSVPMFSLSVVLENVSDDIFPRQLSGGHTHLFTEDSIVKMNQIIGVSSIGEWRFGTDFMDLYRHLMIKMDAKNVSQKMINFLHDGFGSKIDELQNILDSNHACSEIHVVAAKE